MTEILANIKIFNDILHPGKIILQIKLQTFGSNVNLIKSYKN